MSEFSKKSDPVSDVIDWMQIVMNERGDVAASSSSSFTAAFVQVIMKSAREARGRLLHLAGERRAVTPTMTLTENT